MRHNRNWEKTGSAILAVCLIASLLLSNQSFGVFAEEEQSQAAVQEEVQSESVTEEASQDVEEFVSSDVTENVDVDSSDETENGDADIELTPEDGFYSEEDSEADVVLDQEDTTEEEIDEQSLTTALSTEYTFYIDQGNVVFEPTYAEGFVKNNDGSYEKKQIPHSEENVYTITQEDKNIKNYNYIRFHGAETIPYRVVLNNINIGRSTIPDITGDSLGATGNEEGMILIPAEPDWTKKVTLYLSGENIVNGIRYYVGQNSNHNSNEDSYLTIDSFAESGSESGSLYIPEKIDQSDIESFVKQNKNYNHWNAGIGGTDSWETVKGLTLAGGTVQVLTTDGDNCSAIGGGGNGAADISITGGKVTAICSGTGAAIGGGIGYNAAGGDANIDISGGVTYAYNYGQLQSGGRTVGGVAIGGGSSFKAAGSKATVKISGGTVEAYASYGNGIGSGNSALKSTYDAEITIENGKITTNALGGGSSESASGGSATIVVSGGNVKCEQRDTYIGAFGIGGGTSKLGDGGSAIVTVKNGKLDCGTGTIGGGTSKSGGKGGNANITVEDGELYAGNIGGGNAEDSSTAYSGGDAAISISGGKLDCSSIGGGNSIVGMPGAVTSENQIAGVVVTGGTLIAGTIGGGTNKKGDIGFATANISEGTIQGQFILANTDDSKQCFFTMSGGTIDNTALWSGTKNSKYQMAQENGGAVYLTDPNGEVNISGGTIKNCKAEQGGAVYMTAGTVILSGTGKILNCVATGDTENNIEAQGGAIYLKDGTVNVSGGEIAECSAVNGAAVYMQGGSMAVSGGSIKTNTATESGGGAYLAAGNLDISGGNFTENKAPKGAGAYLAGGSLTVRSGEITHNAATESGGGAYLAAGNLDISGGNFTENKAPNGAGAYLAGGNLNVNDNGIFNLNKASENGGAAYLANGTLTLNGGTVSANTATNSGGGFYVADGAVRMFGGNIAGNHADKDGGGFYVSSAENAADIVIRSGSITGNTSGGSGAGMAVVGGENPKADKIILGLLEEHKDLKITDKDRSFTPFDYTDTVDSKNHNHASCPVLQGNIADGDGGGIYMQSRAANLNIYCLKESGNISKTNTNGNGVMMAGGNLVIGDEQNNNKDARGNTDISSAMLVEGGNVDIWGSMDNPLFEKNILVDIQAGAGHFEDHRKQAEDKKRYKIQYFENFTAGGTQAASGMYIASQYDEEDKIYADGTLFKHDGWRILGWATKAVKESNESNNENKISYSIGAFIGGLTEENGDDHTAWENGDTEPLVLYAVWDRSIYTVKFHPNANQYEGSMADQTFYYAVEQSLNPNQYKVTGKRFVGWKDESGKDYAADYKESTMTLTNEGIVDLYAQWVDCTHKGGEHPGTLSYTIDEATNTIIEKCDCDGHTASIGLVAPNGTIYHDGNAHPATIIYPQGTLLANVPTISYKFCATADGTYAEMEVGKEPTDEGFYEASIKVENKTISVRYQIYSASSTVSVDAECIDGQQFGPFNGSATCSIAKDDAFTVLYSIQNLDKAYYSTEPSLVMSQEIPEGTTVIMKANNLYWYQNIETGTTKISLNEFTQMGGDAKFSYNPDATTQEYRLIFDFSKVAESKQLSGTLEAELIYKHNSSDNDSAKKSVKITLDGKGTFSLSRTAESLQIKAPQDKSYSRWDKKNLVLVVTAKDGKQFPADAKLTVESGGKTYYYSKNAGDKFVIPIAWISQGTVKMYLNSDLLSVEKNYSADVKLCVGDEVENSNDQPQAEEYETGAQVTDIPLSVSDTTAPSLRIDGTQKVLKKTDTLNLTIAMEGTDNCTIHATIQQKEASGYDGDFLSANVTSGDNQFSLGGIKEAGSYRLLITVTKNNQAVLTVPYYFIVQ